MTKEQKTYLKNLKEDFILIGVFINIVSLFVDVELTLLVGAPLTTFILMGAYYGTKNDIKRG